jgi:hypothetical protein
VSAGGRLEAALEAARTGAGPVHVLGTGPLAARLRERLAPVPAAAGERPRTVVETTGEPAGLAHACELVDDLGTVVLAAALQGGVALDLYADLHVRGLTLVTIPPASEDAA